MPDVVKLGVADAEAHSSLACLNRTAQGELPPVGVDEVWKRKAKHASVELCSESAKPCYAFAKSCYKPLKQLTTSLRLTTTTAHPSRDIGGVVGTCARADARAVAPAPTHGRTRARTPARARAD